MLKPTESAARRAEPTPRVIDLYGRGETKFANGTTRTIAGEVAGLGRSYRFFASQTLYQPPDLSSGLSVSLRTHSGKSIRSTVCRAWHDAVRTDQTIIDYFADQSAGTPAKPWNTLKRAFSGD